eukprot:gnl/TRDRNA2_/TRDRNA2_181329_c0_seq1.p1 gnl/TRDRNA2_/TRDRNA2_181329_c0~~gnl/TRDRNA2_/TRDRNA2_181329_c0_seq1.p1  ORF type:complete len:608 (+),score=127.25 gnl/TRDRNA2_/TRDRNA2_181329_c0_seq1:114-1826(+)
MGAQQSPGVMQRTLSKEATSLHSMQQKAKTSMQSRVEAALKGCTGWDCLQKYVALPDDSYRFEHKKEQTIKAPGVTIHLLKMNSLKWLNDDITDHSDWVHDLVVVIPDNLKAATPEAGWCILYLGEGGNDDPEEWKADTGTKAAVEVAVRTGTIAANLRQLPQQPTRIAYANGNPWAPRGEEDIRALGWVTISRHPDHPESLVELPMVKASKRALDAIQDFTKTVAPNTPVTRFAVTGHSKRGTATGMLATVDDRVEALAPTGFGLDMHPMIHQFYESYHGMPRAVGDYVNNDYLAYFDTAGGKKHMEIMECSHKWPELWKHKAVLIGQCGNDDFFTVDQLSLNNRFADVRKANTHEAGANFVILPNKDHGVSFNGQGFLNQIIAFFQGVIRKKPMPKMDWVIDDDGKITVTQVSDHMPKSVNLFQATTCDSKKRDFRFKSFKSDEDCQKCGWKESSGICMNTKVMWSKSLLQAKSGTGGKTWEAQLPPPANGGWTAFYIGFEYEPAVQGTPALQFNTEVSVVPKRMAFGKCQGKDCYGESSPGHLMLIEETEKPVALLQSSIALQSPEL